MARTPEKVIAIAYEDGYKLIKSRGYTPHFETAIGILDVPIVHVPQKTESWLEIIIKISVFSNNLDIIGLAVGFEKWRRIDNNLMPCVQLSITSNMDATKKYLTPGDQLPYLMTKQATDTLGRWVNIYLHPVTRQISFMGSKAADIMGLTMGGDRSWLLEEPGREALKAIIGDSLDQTDRYHRLIDLIPQKTAV